jgi:hypothetical protein
MSGTNRNFVLAYAFLVVLPLIGLAGILKSGRGLAAPPAIDGLWSLQLETQQNPSSCDSVLAAIPGKTLSISQSGQSFILSVPSNPKITASGAVAGTAVRASLVFAESSTENGCANPHRFTLVASVDRPAGSTLLAGTLAPADCPSCASVAFRAERQASAPADGGH